MIGSADAAGSAWRRVADTNPCAFCAMLVTRGPVYHTRATALGARRYHNHCGCTAEEYRGDPADWEPTPREQQYVDLYDDSYKPGMSGRETAAAMRANGQGILNDATAPKTPTGSDRPGSARLGRPEWVPEGEDYWAKRQAKLKTDTHGDQLTRDEVLFLEKFESIGEVADWIRRTRAAKTSDFVWISFDGDPWDIKTPSSVKWESMTPKEQYKRIAGRVSDDAPFKKNIIVSLGDRDLTVELTRELSLYNARRARDPDHQIDQLRVMSRGTVHTIALA